MSELLSIQWKFIFLFSPSCAHFFGSLPWLLLLITLDYQYFLIICVTLIILLFTGISEENLLLVSFKLNEITDISPTILVEGSRGLLGSSVIQ